MPTVETIQQITSFLKAANLPWLLPNLRQDLVVWNCLNDPSFLDKIYFLKPTGSAYTPEHLSPGRLALLALDQLDHIDNRKTNLLDAVERRAIQTAVRNFDDQSLFRRNPQDLADAGSIAIALASKFAKNKSWKDMLETIQEYPGTHWLAPIACLLAFVDSPEELLKVFIQPGASMMRYELAVHALLSNPIPMKVQVGTLISLCNSEIGDLLPAQDRLKLINSLHEQRPQIAIEFCSNWLEVHPEDLEKIDQTHIDLLSNIDSMAAILFQEEVKKISGHGQQMSELTELENDIGRRINFALSSRHISNNNPIPSELADHWEGVIQQNKLTSTGDNSSTNKAELAVNLIEHGHELDSKKVLLDHADSNSENLSQLFAESITAFHSGDTQKSRKIAGQIAGLLSKDPTSWKIKIWDDQFSLINLGKLLLDVDLPDDASTVFEQALHTCPNDASLLELLAKSYIACHREKDAVVSYSELVSLYPEDINYHRSLANSLTDISEWEASFQAHTIILEKGRQNGNTTSIQDLHAFAKAALKANHPEIVLDSCNDLINDNQEDSLALILSGEAYLQMNEAEKGMDFLNRATQVTPHLSDPWIALANAQKKMSAIETAIETLKNASQAVPDSSEIHLALGEIYLQKDTPSLALLELQRAAELSPENPKVLIVYGQALKKLGHIELSRSILGKAYSIEPKLPGLAQLYSKILLELGDLEEAISPLEVVIDAKSTKDPIPYLDYARCVLAMNHRGSNNVPPMRALIALNEALQIDPKLAEAKALTAEALVANGDNELAFQAYREALDTTLIEDEKWRERLSLGFGCIANLIGKFDVAIAALQEASQINPDRIEIYMALSDSYMAAGLPEDAIQSARSVLVIEGNDPNNLAWYARQISKIAASEKSANNRSPVVVSKLVFSEALSALDRAIQIEPTRTDLLVQLGNFEVQVGMLNEAHTTFASLATHDFSTNQDLINSAEYLSKIGDHQAAIACLEKGIERDQQNSHNHEAKLYNRLAQEYAYNDNPISALNTLEMAIQLLPNESSFVFQKVETLLGSGKTKEALAWINETINNNPGLKSNIDLLFLGSMIHRLIGDLPSAVKYAEMALIGFKKINGHSDLSQFPIKYRTQIADIYRALLQPDLAYQFIQCNVKPTIIEGGFSQEYIDFICLHTELALETGEQIPSDIQDVQLEPSELAYPRMMAIKARLMNKSGNYRSAEQIYQLAIDSAKATTKLPANSLWFEGYAKYLNLLSIAEAALELGFWDQSLQYPEEIKETHQQEPLFNLNLAKAIICKAEFYNMCEVSEVIIHKPAGDSLSEEAYAQQQHFLEIAQASLEPYKSDLIMNGDAITEMQILRWQARANIAFKHNQDPTFNPGDTLGNQHHPSDIAALIHHIYEQDVSHPDEDAIRQIIKLARNHPRNPEVVVQMAIALSDTDPAEAMKSLQTFITQHIFVKNPWIAFCNLQIVKIACSLGLYDVAHEAIESAIDFWQDEPGWHALAAQIYVNLSDIQGAIGHLITATSIAPNSFAYHMGLGKVYFEHVNDDPDFRNEALKAFEHANILEPKNIIALTSLANVQFLVDDFDSAESNAQMVLELDPNRANINELLSEIALKRCDYQGAYEYAIKAYQLNPKDIHTTITLAHALSALDRDNEALAKLNAMIPTVSEAKLLHLERVNILRKIDGPKAGLKELKSLADSFPDDFNILNALAIAHLEVGELENAVIIAQQALNTRTENSSRNERANLHLLIGQALRQTGQLDQSIQNLNEAIQLAPDRLEPYLELGLARKDRREYSQALQIFEKATVIAPSDPRAPFQAGLALKESKDYKSSETMLRRAVSLAPNDLNIRRQLAAVVALNLVHNPRTGRNQDR